MVATHGRQQIPHALPAHLTTEAGMFGGFPAGSVRSFLMTAPLQYSPPGAQSD
jgi:hypothetical protein